MKWPSENNSDSSGQISSSRNLYYVNAFDGLM